MDSLEVLIALWKSQDYFTSPYIELTFIFELLLSICKFDTSN